MESKTLDLRKRCLAKNFDKVHERYEPDYGMLASDVEPFSGGSGGYHTRLHGHIHKINDTTEHAATIFFLEKEELYPEAIKIFRKVATLQDTRSESKTFGLWPYFAEEDCDHMIAPDYNMADFNARYFAYVLKKKRHLIDDETAEIMTTALYRAAQCSIKRNVSPDYTNISLMSLNTIICAGELCGDEAFFERGKERLRKVHKYDTFCGAFSEYNAPEYGPLALEELGRMTDLFEDAECKKLAEELNYIGWKTLLDHYDTDMCQLAAPNMRCYHRMTGKGMEELIYLGTDGEYGSIDEENIMRVGYFISPPICPQELVDKYLKNKPAKPRFIEEVFYKKNDIRTPDEDTVIIRSLDNPDLTAFTYFGDGYNVGAFEIIDTWTQRNSSTVYWGDSDHVTSMRMICFNDEYEYCSGMVYTNQLNNVLLMHTGFVTDRGDFHYIIDKVKDGKLTTEKLLYLFHFEGDCDNIKVTQDGGHFTIEDKNVKIDLNIREAYFDGEPMKLRYNADKKRIEAICFEGGRSVDFNEIKKPTYMVLTLAVNEVADDVNTEVVDGVVKSSLAVGEKTLTIETPSTPLAYEKAIRSVETSGR